MNCLSALAHNRVVGASVDFSQFTEKRVIWQKGAIHLISRLHLSLVIFPVEIIALGLRIHVY
jgi:hypothetical protein